MIDQIAHWVRHVPRTSWSDEKAPTPRSEPLPIAAGFQAAFWVWDLHRTLSAEGFDVDRDEQIGLQHQLASTAKHLEKLAFDGDHDGVRSAINSLFGANEVLGDEHLVGRARKLHVYANLCDLAELASGL
ncbi:MAG: hypothetical protein R2733_23215 [Acidimicrobiales bacterium]